MDRRQARRGRAWDSTTPATITDLLNDHRTTVSHTGHEQSAQLAAPGPPLQSWQKGPMGDWVFSRHASQLDDSLNDQPAAGTPGVVRRRDAFSYSALNSS